MNIQIYGLGDKRVVVYPLLYLLNQLDGAQLITDDAAYRRLIQGGNGYIGNVAVSVCADGLAARTDDYALTVYDCGHPVADMGEGDETIWVKRSKENGDAPLHQFRTVCVDFERPAGHGKTPFVPLSLSLFQDCHKMETTGRLEAIRSKPAVRALAPVFAEILGHSEKSVRVMLTKGGALI